MPAVSMNIDPVVPGVLHGQVADDNVGTGDGYAFTSFAGKIMGLNRPRLLRPLCPVCILWASESRDPSFAYPISPV